MAELVYNENGRLLFTEEMKEEYTILIPDMLSIHFTFLREYMIARGYKVEILKNDGPGVVVEGLQNVHNDTCYPALLVIGQMIDAIKSGKYDTHKIALILMQTGGGCRASNYVSLLRKALHNNQLDYIPVISFNMYGIESNPGFPIDSHMITEMIYGVVYGDLIMWLANQVRPYELHSGDADALIEKWVHIVSRDIREKGAMRKKHFMEMMNTIASEFAAVPVDRSVKKVKVGIVGEIYVKYSALGNNKLEQFLQSEGAEVVVPGLLDFIIYCSEAKEVDFNLFGGSRKAAIYAKLFKSYLIRLQNMMIKIVERYPQFAKPYSFKTTKAQVDGYVGAGNKMGEGWLLTGEMLELIHNGVPNIVCTQPFGCLPNHIVGKGMIRKIRENNENANIVAIDYDPGATRINQENRIKLMLATARRNMFGANEPAPTSDAAKEA